MQKTSALREKDALLDSILTAYAGNPILSSNLTLQGGGALHFIYGAPRYSSDLDFVCPTLCQLQDVIAPVLEGGISGDINVPAIVKNVSKGFIRVSYRQGDFVGKVELYEQKAFTSHPTTGKYHPLLVETPKEIYADKIAASMARMCRRDSIKGTDLFDLEYLRSTLGVTVPFSEVLEKSTSYGERDFATAPTLNRIISHINNPTAQREFTTHLQHTMLPDVFESMQFNSQYFERCTEHFAQYLGTAPQ